MIMISEILKATELIRNGNMFNLLEVSIDTHGVLRHLQKITPKNNFPLTIWSTTNMTKTFSNQNEEMNENKICD